MHQGYATAGEAKQAVESTINERINRVCEGIQHQIDRLSGVLSRVNGSPPTQPGPNRDSVAQIRPVMPLTNAVEQLQEMQARLSDIATGIERIA